MITLVVLFVLLFVCQNEQAMHDYWFVLLSFVLACFIDRSVQHQSIGVPQSTGFSFQPLQPNILTTPFLALSSPYQHGHCLWTILHNLVYNNFWTLVELWRNWSSTLVNGIVWTLNNTAQSWILIMDTTFFILTIFCTVS